MNVIFIFIENEFVVGKIKCVCLFFLLMMIIGYFDDDVMILVVQPIDLTTLSQISIFPTKKIYVKKKRLIINLEQTLTKYISIFTRNLK